MLVRQCLSFPKIVLAILKLNMYQVNTLFFMSIELGKGKFGGRQKIGIESSLFIVTGSFNNTKECFV